MIYHLIRIVTQAEEDSDPDIADDSCSTAHRGKRSVGSRLFVGCSKSRRVLCKEWKGSR